MDSSSYLSDSEKDDYDAQFFNLHKTFARPITIWKSAQQIVITTNPANNYLFESAPFNDTTNIIQVSGVFQARILYNKNEELKNFTTTNRNEASDQINILRQAGDVRIRVDVTGANYLFDAKRVTFDGEIFNVTTSQRPHGLFNPNFYDFFLTKLN